MKYVNRPIIVLGMHRSATSLIARSLHKEGVVMGEKFLEDNKGNDGGHYENLYFVSLNDIILKAAGGSWDNPPEESKILEAGERFSNEIQGVIKMATQDKWGWKDPRTVLTIKCYMPYLDDPFLITCFRKPMEVAESLHDNYGMDFNESFDLAKEYNRRLINFMESIYG